MSVNRSLDPAVCLPGQILGRIFTEAGNINARRVCRAWNDLYKNGFQYACACFADSAILRPFRVVVDRDHQQTVTQTLMNYRRDLQKICPLAANVFVEMPYPSMDVLEKLKGDALLDRFFDNLINKVPHLLGLPQEQKEKPAASFFERTKYINHQIDELSRSLLSPEDRGTIICTAITDGLYDIVPKFLEHGSISEEARGMAVRKAANSGRCIDIINVLLANGSISENDRGLAVRMACLNGDLPTLELLLANGSISEAHRGFAARLALSNGFRSEVMLLLANGSVSEEDRGTLVIMAAQRGDIHLVELLLSKESIAEKDRGEAIVECMAQYPEIVEVLLANKAIISQDTRDQAISAAFQNRYYYLVVQLSQANEAPLSEDVRGTVVIAAAKWGDIQTIQRFAADAAISDADRDQAIRTATKRGYASIAAFLHEA